MKKLFSILLILVSFAAFSQQKVMTTGYKYIKNDVAAWSVSSGTFVNGGTFPNDYIQCNVAGVMSIPSTQAYGEWYFDFYKGNMLNLIRIGTSCLLPVAPQDGTQTSYYIAVTSEERISLNKRIVGVLTALNQTISSYIANTTWYNIKITRSATGIFTTYIKGGVYGNIWTLISVSSGTNPSAADNTYTTSNYFVVDLDAGDRIANVRFEPSTGYNTVIK